MLLRLPTASAGELAAGLNMSLLEVRRALRGLESRGLVGRLPGAAHRFQASPPGESAGPLARLRHRALRAIGPDAGAPAADGPDAGGPDVGGSDAVGPDIGGSRDDGPQSDAPQYDGPRSDSPDTGGSDAEGSDAEGSDTEGSERSGIEDAGPARHAAARHAAGQGDDGRAGLGSGPIVPEVTAAGSASPRPVPHGDRADLRPGPNPRSGVDVVRGTPGHLRRQGAKLLAGATAEVCVVGTAPVTDLGEVPAGVRVRVIHPRTALAGRESRRRIAAYVADGVLVRVCDLVPADMLVVDRAVALLPGRDAAPAERSAVVVWPGGLHDTLLAVFERVWAVGTPLRVPAGDQLAEDRDAGTPTSEDLALLRLLLDGLTDQTIAGRLGVGVRTVQRHVRELSDAVGAQTRLQLVWHATQRGWL